MNAAENDTVASPTSDRILQMPEYLAFKNRENVDEMKRADYRMYVFEAYLWHFFVVGFCLYFRVSERLQAVWPRYYLYLYGAALCITYSYLLAADFFERMLGERISKALVKLSTYCLAALPVAGIVLLYKVFKFWSFPIGLALFMSMIMAPSLLFWRTK